MHRLLPLLFLLSLLLSSTALSAQDKTFYPDGQLQSEEVTKDGMFLQTYYMNGELKSKTRYVLGIESGTERYAKGGKRLD